MSDKGDYVVDSSDECELTFEAEPLLGYLDGKFYPVKIGEKLNDRYKVEHKLGYGGFATVWMAEDTTATLKPSLVALKIVQPGEIGEHERRIQNEIIHSIRDRSRLNLYQDKFYLQGSHGSHLVLVLPLQGPSFQTVRYKSMTISARLSVAKQVLEGLKTFHDGGFIHQGKLC